MTAPSNVKSGVGFRHCQLFELDSNGNLAAVDENVFEGLHLSGVRSLTLDIPEPQQINHLGDDRIFARDTLPPTEGAGGTLVVGKNNFDVDALITGQNVVTIGETKFFGRATDMQGSEAQVCVLAWRQALDTTPGASRVRYWDIRLLPICQLIPANANFDGANPEDKSYTIVPQVAAAYPWGIGFATGTEGFTEAQILDATTVYKPKLVAFKGDGTATQFDFSTDYPAVNTDKITTWHTVAATGVTTEITPDTVAVTGVTITAAPAAGDIITVWYEYN